MKTTMPHHRKVFKVETSQDDEEALDPIQDAMAALDTSESTERDPDDDDEVFDEDEVTAILAAWNDAPGAGKNKAEAKKRIDDLKRRTKCKACDQVGHWHKDPECPKQKGASAGTKRTDTPRPQSKATWAQARQTVKDRRVARGYRPVTTQRTERSFLVCESGSAEEEELVCAVMPAQTPDAAPSTEPSSGSSTVPENPGRSMRRQAKKEKQRARRASDRAAGQELSTRAADAKDSPEDSLQRFHSYTTEALERTRGQSPQECA